MKFYVPVFENIPVHWSSVWFDHDTAVLHGMSRRVMYGWQFVGVLTVVPKTDNMFSALHMRASYSERKGCGYIGLK